MKCQSAISFFLATWARKIAATWTIGIRRNWDIATRSAAKACKGLPNWARKGRTGFQNSPLAPAPGRNGPPGVTQCAGKSSMRPRPAGPEWIELIERSRSEVSAYVPMMLLFFPESVRIQRAVVEPLCWSGETRLNQRLSQSSELIIARERLDRRTRKKRKGSELRVFLRISLS